MHNANENNQQAAQSARETVSKGNSLSSIMIEQIIIQTALISIEMFNGTKCKFEVWTQAIENAAQNIRAKLNMHSFPLINRISIFDSQ